MSRSFISIFGLEGGQDVRRTAIAAVKAGYAVVPVVEAGKAPVCTLNTRELRAAGTDHPCGVHHAITDPAVADKVFKRLTRHGALINLGVVAGPSRLLVVDADTAEEVAAFQRDWADADGEGYADYTPTVLTPGLRGEGDDWRHKDGGHWYFALPEGVELDWTVKGTMKHNGYDVRWGMSQTLVPPSARPEGAYVPTGDILPAPQWLIDRVLAYLAEASERRLQRAALTANDDIGAWAVSVSWASILEAQGWSDTGKADRCGCGIWTKPGGGSTSSKSATAHEADCTQYDNIEGHGPLHLWTTEPPEELAHFVEAGKQTLTKLQVVAAYEYGGDTASAMAGLRIGEDRLAWLNDESQPNPSLQGETPAQPDPESPSPSTGDSVIGADMDADRPLPNPAHQSRPSFWIEEDGNDEERRAIIHESKNIYRRERAREYLNHKRGLSGPTMDDVVIALDDDVDPVVPDVASREDGVHLLYRGRVNTIFGPSEAGKSWFTLACAATVVAASGQVVVIDLEDDRAGFVGRLRTIGLDPAERVRYMRPFTGLGAADRKQIAEACAGADLVIIDSLDAYLALNGLDSNNAVAIRTAGAWMKSLAASTGAAVLLVDHSTEKIDGPARTQLGSSAKKQFIDGATYRADRRTAWRPGHQSETYVMAGKDRHGWAKAHAEFGDDPEWGRMALLSLAPDIADDGNWTARLRLRKPPSYTEDSGTSADELTAIEDLMIARAREKEGEWISRTDLLKAGGDKNGRGPQPEALERLVKQEVLEHEEVQLRAGKVGHRYRYVPLDDGQSLDP